MTARHAWVAIVIATGLLVLCHLFIRFGNEWLYHVGSTALMPGVIAEMWLSANSLEGFGDWRTPVVINAVTWLFSWVAVIIGFRLWRFVTGR